MKRFPLITALFLCVIAPAVRAGVQEDYPDIFPKEPASPGEKNGWDVLSSMKKISQEDWKGMPNALELGPEQFSRMDRRKARDLAAKYAGELQLLGEAMSAPRLQSGDWRTFKLDDAMHFPLMETYRTALLMLWNGAADAQEGNVQQGMEAALRTVRFGLRACEAEPMMGDMIFGMWLIRAGAETAAYVATIPGFEGAALRKAAQDMDACDRVAAAMRLGVRGEGRWALMFCESLLKGGEARRKAVMEMAAMKEWSASIFAGERNKTKEDTGMEGLLKQWEEKMPEKVQAAVRDADRVDWKTHLETHAAFVRALIKANNHSLAAFRASFDPPKDNVVTKGTALEPYFDSETGSGSEMPFIRLTSNASSRVRLARAILLLRAYELDHGRLPTSLGEMIPDYWPSVPEDPFDGKPLRYDAATRRVWCVGENLKDDKGDLASAPFPAQWCVGENLKDDKGANDYKAKDKPDDVGMTFPVWK